MIRLTGGREKFEGAAEVWPGLIGSPQHQQALGEFFVHVAVVAAVAPVLDQQLLLFAQCFIDASE
jgi:hypothetical protein